MFLWYNNCMKTIIITGASGGIGSEIVSTLAEKNVNLVLTYNKHKKVVDELKKKLSTKCNIVVCKCDLTVENEVEKMVETAQKKFGKIDCLVNCAGVSQFKQIQDVTVEDFNNIINNNLLSIVLATKHIAKNMISNKAGKIVNISSMWGVVGASMESVYSASKGAINTLTLSLAKELGPSGITVNAVCPGLIDTKMNNCLSVEDKQAVIDSTPLARIGKPKDVAQLVKFLLSNNADFITGQIITIDGGLTL